MADREYDRMPFSVQVEFRTASSFLVAYSVNLSRGGLFIETPNDVAPGSAISVDLAIPGAGQIRLNGIVAWRRPEIEVTPENPPGFGVELQDVAPALGG